MFPNIYLYGGSEAALVAGIWDMALDISNLTTYADTALLLQLQKVAAII